MPLVKTINLTEGMLIDSPVSTSHGQLILNKGTLITKEIIKTLNIWDIEEVKIKEVSTKTFTNNPIFFEKKNKSLNYLHAKFHLLEGELYEILIDACAERIINKDLKSKSNDQKYNIR